MFSSLLYRSFLFCTLLVCLSSCVSSKPSVYTIEGKTMGTSYQVKIADSSLIKNIDKIKKNIDKILRSINRKMSTYDKTSELTLFNDYHKDDWYTISGQTYDVIKRALQVSKNTGGAFDITVGPLVNLWGFGAKGSRRQNLPDSVEIEEVKKSVGSSHLELHPTSYKIKKKKVSLYLDLSAIAKGYGVDVVSNYLALEKLKNHMVEIGGEVRLSGYRDPEKKTEWKIAIEVPEPEVRKTGRILSLTNVSMATSGDYRNFFTKDGQRFSHTIDPRSGRPITHNLTSVTVFDSDCINADAYATALSVMGHPAGLKWVNDRHIKAIFYLKTPHGFEEILSKPMQNYLAKQE